MLSIKKYFLRALPLIACCLLCINTQYLHAQEATIEEEGIVDTGTEINVKNADIAAIIRIFSNRTKRNYILDERVKGKVSIYLPGRVNAEEAIRILDSVLALKGFTAVPIGDNLWKIIPSQEAKQTTIPTVDSIEGRGSPMMVTKLINLKYIAAADAQQLVAGLISPFGLVNAYSGANSLILIDSEENIQRITQLIDAMDIPFTDQDMTLIPIEHADAPDIAEKIKQILLDEKAPDGQAGLTLDNRARLRNTGQQNSQEGITSLQSTSMAVAARAREPKIIADERTNSLIVIADEDITARIRALVSELDSPVNLSGSRFYVYRCQHATAADLAEVLSGLVSGDSSTGSSGSTNNRSGNFGSSGNTGSDRTPLSDRTARTQDRLSRQNRTPGQSRTNEQPRMVSGGGSVQFSEDFSITADTATNSLIISANKSDYEKVLDLLKQIDIKRRQVLVEAMILEVAVSDSVTTGMEFLTSTGGSDGGVLAVNNYGGLTQLLANPTQLSQFSVAAASAGTLTLPGGISIPTQTVLLTAASNNSNVNVLSSPTILATDNQDAEIVVGQNVPFLASTSSSTENLNNTFNQIDRQDVGITLRITPQINSNDYVTLRLFTEVSSLDEATVTSPLGPTTRVRTSETTVVTRDNQMIVIGGLISDAQSEADQGIPYLKNIPILGHAFQRKTVSSTKTNLLIFIIPRIIKDQFDARDITRTKGNVLGEAIEESGSQPDRTDVLDNMNIDRVIEGHMHDGEKPGTIRPSVGQQAETLALDIHPSTEHLFSKPNAEFKPAAANKPANTDNSAMPQQPTKYENELLEFEFEPQKPMPFEDYDPRARMANGSASNSKKISKASKYVVLQLNEQTSSAPFQLARGNLFGVALPGQANEKVINFFKSGSHYSFSQSGKDLRIRALGVFDSAEEAQEFYQELKGKEWHNLTPNEVLNLGSGPWRMAALH